MRVEGWQRKLNLYLQDVQRRYVGGGLQWGVLDCAHYAGDWVQILTGVDPIADLRGTYSTEAGAVEILAAEGGLRAALVSRLGDPVNPARATRGDVAYREDETALGIYLTSGVQMRALFLGRGGFTMHRLRDTDLAFPAR